MLAKLRLLALLLALIVATIPSFMYITDKNRDILWILIGVNIFAYITVALTTIQTTLDVAGRDKQKLPVPARFENNPILAKWWVAVRLSWRWHAVAALARLGLAHGLAQHLRVGTNFSCELTIFREILAPFCYASLRNPLFPQLETIFIGMLFILFFALLENQFIAALALGIDAFFIASVKGKILMTFFLRLLIVWLIVGTLALVANMNFYHHRSTLRVLETGIIGMFTLIDNSILLSANIMRPVPIEGVRDEFAVVISTTEDAARYFIYSVENRPFVLRNVVAGFFGLLLYAFLTGCCLFFAQRRYRQQKKIAAHAV